MYTIIFGMQLSWRLLLNFQISKVRGAPTSDLAKTSQGKYTHASHLYTHTCTYTLTPLIKTEKTGSLVCEYLIFCTYLLMLIINLPLLPNTIRRHARTTVGRTDAFLQALRCMINRGFIYLDLINLDHTLL